MVSQAACLVRSSFLTKTTTASASKGVVGLGAQRDFFLGNRILVSPAGRAPSFRTNTARCFASTRKDPLLDVISPSGTKVWTARTCLDDHIDVVAQLPRILGAYVGPNAIEPKLNESIMVTVNSENQCPYCTGLHGELARMAGVEKVSDLLNANNVEECTKTVADDDSKPAIEFARIFAEDGGRGARVKEAMHSIAQHYGDGKAKSINALCWFLKWGSLGGNTLNAGFFDRMKGNPVHGSSVGFEIAYTVYYGPLFAVIALMNAGLKFAPPVPPPVLSGVGVLLTFCGGSWMLPVRVIAAATYSVTSV